ncbi:MAG: hypothetical protein LBG59_09090 [Candidatus Peribacteria bacterium]|jgi:CRISPR-associated protein Cpf1|nr:hypothetical protein [Candidatus Peribacteria bacterium]
MDKIPKAFIFYQKKLMSTPAFSSFTNLYDLSKTLRFELKPIGETKTLLDEQNELFPMDKRIAEIYQNIIKPCLNDLHSQLIEASLTDIGLSNLDESIYQIRITDRNGKQRKDAKKTLRKEIVGFLTNSKFAYADSCKKLMDKEVIDIIITVFGEMKYQKSDDKKKVYNHQDLLGQDYKTIIKKYFKGLFTYLTNFNTNRANLYKDDGKASRVATRCIDENLTKFFQNKQLYESKIEPHHLLTSDQQELFSTLSYSNFLNQKGIENYNAIIAQINSLTNQYNQTSHFS